MFYKKVVLGVQKFIKLAESSDPIFGKYRISLESHGQGFKEYQETVMKYETIVVEAEKC